MLPLFLQHDVAAVSVPKYVSWFLDPDSDHYNLIQLPPIQRNAVWNIAQVERLWDSLLRGFPIGSMLLAHRSKSHNARPLTSSEQRVGDSDGYFLLDGQQRTRALLLGFLPSATSRLWVDLSPNLQFDNPEFNDRQFIFRLLTNQQPWGMRDRNPEDKLNEPEKAAARRQLAGKPRYDYQTSPVSSPDGPGVPSWPVDARLPIPLDALIQLCGGWSGQFTSPRWEQVSQLIPTAYPRLETAPPHVAKLLLALQRLLAEIPIQGRPCRSLPLLLHAGDEEATSSATDNVPDAVEVLFRRVNAGGTVLAGEEMAYSLLKSTWDKAYNLVTQITEHEEVGYLLSPTRVVMAAARLARRQQGHMRDLNPSVPQFRRWLGQSSSTTEPIAFLPAMQELLGSLAGQPEARFTQTLVQFCRLALYNLAASPTDPGLPKKLLLEINPILLHPVFSWVLDNLSTPILLTANRLSVLRYLMYVLIVKPDAQKFAKFAGEVLTSQSAGCNFPDQAIYGHWLRQANAPVIPDSSQIILSVPTNSVVGWLSNGQELFGTSEATEEVSADRYHAFRSYFWHDKRLALWFQRAYLERWFAGYNPMSQDTADTPFDYDHILPYSHAVCSGRSLELEEAGKGADRFYSNRWFYLNSLGNFRAWPAWANRSDGNKCHTDKLCLKGNASPGQEIVDGLQIESAADFLQASVILSEDQELWLAAGGYPGYWPVARRTAWQQAVERRTCALYRKLFTTLEYSKWQGLELKLNESPVLLVTSAE